MANEKPRVYFSALYYFMKWWFIRCSIISKFIRWKKREREICFFFLKRIVQIGGKLSMFYECSLFHWPRIEMASWDQFECACYYHCPMRAIKIESKQSFYFFSIRFLHASIAVWIGKEWNDCRFCGLPRICAERYWRCMPGNMKCRTNIFFFCTLVAAMVLVWMGMRCNESATVQTHILPIRDVSPHRRCTFSLLVLC